MKRVRLGLELEIKKSLMRLRLKKGGSIEESSMKLRLNKEVIDGFRLMSCQHRLLRVDKQMGSMASGTRSRVC